MKSNYRTNSLSLLIVSACLFTSHVSAFSTPKASIRQSPVFGVSHHPPIKVQLFAKDRLTGLEKERHQRMPLLINFLSRMSQKNPMKNRFSKLLAKFRQAVALICFSAMLWFGSGAVPPANAAATTASIHRVLPSATLDQMVERYVKDHMFDDDVYDPLESAYREAYDDATVGQFPKALKEITTTVMGKEKTSKEHNTVVTTVLHMSQGLQKMGLSQGTAVAAIAASTIIGVPLAATILFSAYTSFSQSRLQVFMKSRYGDDYSVDAAVKNVEDVEAPPDEDDEDDEDDDDDDNDDDDDDDDDGKKK